MLVVLSVPVRPRRGRAGRDRRSWRYRCWRASCWGAGACADRCPRLRSRSPRSAPTSSTSRPWRSPARPPSRATRSSATTRSTSRSSTTCASTAATWSDIPVSSYGAVLDLNLGNGYPLGPHYQLASLVALLDTDVAWLYQGYVSAVAALVTIPAARLLREFGLGHSARGGRRLRGGVGLPAVLLRPPGRRQGADHDRAWCCSARCFAAQLAASERPVRPAVLLAVPMAAAFTVYSAGGLPWFGVMVVVALGLAVARSPERGRTLALGVGALAAVFALGDRREPRLRDRLLRPREASARKQHGRRRGQPRRGAAAVGVARASGSRATTASSPSYEPLTYALIALAGVLAVRRGRPRSAAAGARPAPRRRRVSRRLGARAGRHLHRGQAARDPLAGPGRSSPSVAARRSRGRAGCARQGRWPRGCLPAAVLVSDGMAYRDAYIAPKDRLDELREVGERFAGSGPTMLDEFEEYGKHFLRRSDRDRSVRRLRAGAGRPALAGADLRDLGRSRRADARLRARVPRDRAPAQPDRQPPSVPLPAGVPGRLLRGLARPTAAFPPCSITSRTATAPTRPARSTAPSLAQLAARPDAGTLVAALRPSPIRLVAAEMENTAGWPVLPDGRVGALRAGELRGAFDAPAGRYRVWVRGTFGRGVDVLVDGGAVGARRIGADARADGARRRGDPGGRLARADARARRPRPHAGQRPRRELRVRVRRAARSRCGSAACRPSARIRCAAGARTGSSCSRARRLA